MAGWLGGWCIFCIDATAVKNGRFRGKRPAGGERFGIACRRGIALAARLSLLPTAWPAGRLSYRSPAVTLLPAMHAVPAMQVVCEVEDAHAGEIIETLTLRKGEVRPLPCLPFCRAVLSLHCAFWACHALLQLQSYCAVIRGPPCLVALCASAASLRRRFNGPLTLSRSPFSRPRSPPAAAQHAAAGGGGQAAAGVRMPLARAHRVPSSLCRHHARHRRAAPCLCTVCCAACGACWRRLPCDTARRDDAAQY